MGANRPIVRGVAKVRGSFIGVTLDSEITARTPSRISYQRNASNNKGVVEVLIVDKKQH